MLLQLAITFPYRCPQVRFERLQLSLLRKHDRELFLQPIPDLNATVAIAILKNEKFANFRQ